MQASTHQVLAWSLDNHTDYVHNGCGHIAVSTPLSYPDQNHIRGNNQTHSKHIASMIHTMTQSMFILLHSVVVLRRICTVLSWVAHSPRHYSLDIPTGARFGDSTSSRNSVLQIPSKKGEVDISGPQQC